MQVKAVKEELINSNEKPHQINMKEKMAKINSTVFIIILNVNGLHNPI